MIRLLSAVSVIISLGISLLAIASPLLWVNANNEWLMVTGFCNGLTAGIACIAGALLTAATLSMSFGVARA